MKCALKKCSGCGTYSMKDICPECGRGTSCAIPPRYSPEDRYGEYRRRSIIEEHGENGKCDPLRRGARAQQTHRDRGAAGDR